MQLLLRNRQIKSNQIKYFSVQEDAQITQYKELIQSLEQGHKGLWRATHLYPKIMQKN